MKNKSGEVVLDQEELNLLKDILVTVPILVKNQERKMNIYGEIIDLLKNEILRDKEHMISILKRIESLEGKKKPVDDVMVR